MYPLHGRWIVNYFSDDNEGKSFDEIQSTCLTMKSEVMYVKEARDLWSPDWVARRKGGPNKEMYIGLDPNGLRRACTAIGWSDECEGLRWLDGTPYDRRVVTWGVETNGQTSIGCFIITLHSNSDQMYIRGVNDCEVKRTAACVSQCLIFPRCPIPFELDNGKSDWNIYEHVQGDQVRLVLLFFKFDSDKV